MRIEYTDDEDFPGQFFLWQANCGRSLRSFAGQLALRGLESALLALPERKLIYGAFADQHGVCAIGALAEAIQAQRGVDRNVAHYELSTLDPEDNEAATQLAETLQIPRLVAWKIVEVNDITYERATEEARYAGVLAWVREQLHSAERANS